MNIAAYPKYESYKDSGFAPVGEIPTHWRHSRIRHAAEISPSRRLDGNTGREEQVVFLPMEAVGDNGQIDQSNIRLSREVSEGFTYFQRGDVVMAKITPCFENGKGAYLKELSTKYGFGTTELHVMRPREVTGKFLYYFLNRSAFRTYSEVFMVGSAGQKRVSTDFLKNQLIPIPPLPEQRAIAAFLDGKCATIDEAVRIKEEQIRLLAERRQILIQEAVTRGLNPDAAMKDSGIDWIGQIPAHWDVRSIRYAFKFRNNQRIPLSGPEREHMQGQYPYYGASGIIDFVEDYIFDEDLILIAEDGANLLSKSTPLAFVARGKYWVNNHAHILEPLFAGFEYWAELLSAVDYTVYISGSAQPKLTRDRLASVRVPIPPADEREAIVELIKVQSGKFRSAIAIKESQITALREYKTSLINAAVTGKIKVL